VLEVPLEVLTVVELSTSEVRLPPVVVVTLRLDPLDVTVSAQML
jgi:hypothetical protein